MKIGFRKPSLKKTLKARTTGKLKRASKRAINPLHGKKGMGLAANPKKAVYNKVYHKTTIGISDITKTSTTNNKITKTTSLDKLNTTNLKIYSILIRILSIIVIIFSLAFFSLGTIGVVIGILIICFGIFLYRLGLSYKSICNKRKDWN